MIACRAGKRTGERLADLMNIALQCADVRVPQEGHGHLAGVCGF
jgi:hypothetical protein